LSQSIVRKHVQNTNSDEHPLSYNSEILFTSVAKVAAIAIDIVFP